MSKLNTIKCQKVFKKDKHYDRIKEQNMELKEKLGMLNENSSVAQIQQYIKDMKKDSIANINNVDIFKAFQDKERKNCNRIWK